MDKDATLFLFDIDGTLLPPLRVHRAAFEHAFRTVYDLSLDLDGVHASGRTDCWILADILRRAGLSDEQIWKRLPEAYAAMEEYVSHHLRDLRQEVLPGVREVLRRLRDEAQLLGLLTGNLQGIAIRKMEKAGLSSYLKIGGFGEESEVRARLIPVALKKVEESTGREVAAARTVIIGDTPLDVEAGRAHGTLTVGVSTGAYSTAELREVGADLVFRSFEDAPSTVDALLRLTGFTQGHGSKDASP